MSMTLSHSHSSRPPSPPGLNSSKESKYQSPFTHILHTNYAPTNTDAQKIRDFCVAPEQEIEQLELEISRLEASLNVVRRERDALRDIVTAHRALLSPIRKLPSEVLQEIFAWCVLELPAMHVSVAPLLPGRVCRSWRSIVYATPELWSAVHIVIPSMRHTGPHLHRLEAAREWLARSGDRPVRISLYADHTAGEIGAFLDLIVPLSPRWESIALLVSPIHFKQLEQSFSGINTLSRLRRFELSDSYRWSHAPFIDFSDSPYPLHLLKQCTNLHCVSVHVSGPHQIDLPISIAIGLQELDVDCGAFSSDLNQLLNFITLCQNLCTLRIRTSFESVPVFQPLHLVTLPALECLVVDMYCFVVNATPALTLLEYLVTPRLLHFHLTDLLDVKDVSFSLVKLLARSSCSLRTLSLRVTAEKQDLQPLLSPLEYAPELRKLTIECLDQGLAATDDGNIPNRDHNAFLLALAYTDTSTNYCPNLTHLTLSNFTPMGVDTDSLQTLVRSRLEPPPDCARLQTLDLEGVLPPVYPNGFENVMDPGYKASLDLLKELQIHGLTVLLPDLSLFEGSSLLSSWTGIMPH